MYDEPPDPGERFDLLLILCKTGLNPKTEKDVVHGQFFFFFFSGKWSILAALRFLWHEFTLIISEPVGKRNKTVSCSPYNSKTIPAYSYPIQEPLSKFKITLTDESAAKYVGHRTSKCI